MTQYLDPKTGQTIGYQATKGTTAEPFNVPMAWQASTLSYVTLNADASGNLAVSGGGGGGVGTQYAQGTTNATPTGTVAMGKTAANVLQSLGLDANGNLNVNLAAGSISGGNAAASTTGSPVPANADYSGWNNGGNLVGTSLTTGLPVQPGTGTVFPVSGTFWQATQPVSGTVAATQSGTWNIGSITTLPAITGSVSVSNFPATQAISGSVSVSNFPASQAVTGTFWQATQPISGSVSVTNFPSSGTTTSFSVAQPVYLDDQNVNLDDNGNLVVSVDTSMSDVATTQLQQSQLNSLQQLVALETQALSQVGTVAVNNFPVITNPSLESAGNLQKIADIMELMLTELRVISASISQLGQPVQDGPEQLRNDYQLLQ